MTLAGLFLIVIFMSIVSAAAWLMLLLVQSIGRIRLPHGLYVGFMVFSMVPVKLPYQKWVDTDPTHIFLAGFKVAAGIWMAGTVLLMFLMLTKAVILKFTMRKFICGDDLRVSKLVEECSRQLKIRQAPAVMYGTLREPACVVSCLNPAVILSKAAIIQLTENELHLVLQHELTHVKRRHLFLKRAFDILCCIHWFNPLIWIARYKFAISCEMDCDRHVIEKLSCGSEPSYVKMLLRLVELSFPGQKPLLNSAGVLAFTNMKQRMQALLIPDSKLKRITAAALSAVIISTVLWLSVELSKNVFPPYGNPYGDNQLEWSEQSHAGH